MTRPAFETEPSLILAIIMAIRNRNAGIAATREAVSERAYLGCAAKRAAPSLPRVQGGCCSQRPRRLLARTALRETVRIGRFARGTLVISP